MNILEKLIWSVLHGKDFEGNVSNKLPNDHWNFYGIELACSNCGAVYTSWIRKGLTIKDVELAKCANCER